jgi:hypothetical protein
VEPEAKPFQISGGKNPLRPFLDNVFQLQLETLSGLVVDQFDALDAPVPSI